MKLDLEPVEDQQPVMETDPKKKKTVKLDLEPIEEPVKKKESTSPSGSGLGKRAQLDLEPLEQSSENGQVSLTNKQRDDISKIQVGKNKSPEQLRDEFQMNREKVGDVRRFVTGEKKDEDTLTSLEKGITGVVKDAIPGAFASARAGGVRTEPYTEKDISNPDAIKDAASVLFRKKISDGDILGALSVGDDEAKKYISDQIKNPQFHQEQVQEKLRLFEESKTQQEEFNKYTENTVKSLSDIESPGDVASYVAYNVGQSIPQAGMALLSGGMSGYVQEHADIYDQQIQKIAQDKGISEEEVIRQGLDDPEAGQGAALIAGALDRIGVEAIFKNFGKDAFKNILRSSSKNQAAKAAGTAALKTATTEGVTEGAQYIVEEVGSSLTAGRSAGESIKDVSGNKLIESIAAGATSGGILGGAGSVMNHNRTSQEVANEESMRIDPSVPSEVNKSAEAIQEKIDQDSTINKSTEPDTNPITQPPVLTEESSEVDQKSGDVIPRPAKPISNASIDKSVIGIKSTLEKAGKITKDENGEVVVKQNSGYPSQLFDDLSKIMGDKTQALNEYLKIKDDAGEFKKKFGDWENQIMKEYGREGHEYTVKRATPDDANKNEFSWTYSDEKGNPIIIFNDKKVRRESDFTKVKKEYEKDTRDQSEGSAIEKTEYQQLYNNTINKLRDLKLHLIHKALIKKQKGTVSMQDNIRSIKEIERLNSIDLAKDYYGEPMIFMHSGAAGIEKFLKPGDKGYDANDAMTGGSGIYFTRSPKGAGFYSRLSDAGPAKGMDIYYTFLRTKNPYYMSDPRAQADYKIESSETLSKKDEKELRSRGYDSVIWDKEGTPKREIVVFDPDQVEIIGTYRHGIKTKHEARKLSGIKKSLVSAETVGATPLERRSTEDMLMKAKEQVDSGEIDPKSIVDEIAMGTARALQPDEVAALVYYKTQLDNQSDALNKDLIDAINNGDEATELRLRTLAAAIQEDFDRYETMSVKTAYEQSLAFRLRMMLLNNEYNLETQVNKYKAVNNGVIPKEIEDKFRDLDSKLKEANLKLQKFEEEKNTKEAEKSLLSIRQSLERDRNRRKKLITEDKKVKINNFFDSLKVKDVGGTANDITRVIGSAVWNGSLEVMKKAILAGADVANAVQAGIDYVKENYRGSDFNEEDFRSAVQPGMENSIPSASIKISAEPSIKNGNLSIPESLIRNVVASGAKNIDEVVSKIQDRIKSDMPEVTPREIRDAVTQYGKVRNMSQDDISKKIREIKRAGKAISSLEDIQNRKRPLRSGLQRDKLSDQERNIQREIREKLKDLPMDEAESDQAWKNALDTVKSRLKNQIADLNKQLESGEKSEKKKGIRYDEEASLLKEQRDQLNKAISQLEGKPTVSDEQKIRMAISTVERSIAEYERKISTKDFSEKNRPSTPITPELKALREKRDQVKETYRQMERDAGVAQKKQLENYKKAVRKGVQTYEDRIKSQDFVTVKKQPLELDDEAKTLAFERDKIKSEFQVLQEKNRLKNRPMTEKVWDTTIDVLNLPKSLLATADMSAPFRQGFILSVGNPVAASKAFPEMFRQAWSQNTADKWLHGIKNSPEYMLMKNSKLYLAEPSTKLTAKEEQFLSNIAGKIPILGRFVKASERAYSGYLNKIRVDVFASGVEHLQNQGITFESDPKSYEAWADFINNATGRGNLGKLDNLAPALNAALFSPRYIASRFNLLNPVKYASMPAEVRKMALKNMASYIGFGVMVLLMAKAAGAEVEDDPRSTDFGKIKVGNTRYDIWAGFQQPVRFFAQLISGQKKQGDKIKAISGRKDKKDKAPQSVKEIKSRLMLSGKFLRSKASPVVGSVVNFYTGTNMIGEPVTIESELYKNMVPLYLQDVESLYSEEGATGLATTAIPAFFGIGVQSYDKK